MDGPARTPADPYVVLGVSRSASAREIRAAWRQAVKVGHPDVGGDPEQFRRTQQAFEVLSDPRRRRAHDRDSSLEKAASAQRWAANMGRRHQYRSPQEMANLRRSERRRARERAAADHAGRARRLGIWLSVAVVLAVIVGLAVAAVA